MILNPKHIFLHIQFGIFLRILEIHLEMRFFYGDFFDFEYIFVILHIPIVLLKMLHIHFARQN